MNETEASEQANKPPELEQGPIITHKKRSWLKRLLVAILLPIFLFLFAGLVISILGPTSLQIIEQGLNQFWVYATAFRLLLIAGISFIVVPTIVRRSCEDKDNRIRQLTLNSDEESQVQSQILQKQLQGLQQIKPWVIAVVLVIMDICLLQIPFIIK